MNNKLEKSKKLIQNVFLFFLASFIPKTISFFMVPLYTECLSTLEYGTIDLITTTVQLLLPILTLQVQDAILRFSVAGQDDPRKVFSIGLRIVSAGFVFLASATFLLTMLGCGPERSLHCFFSCKLSHRCAGQCCELFFESPGQGQRNHDLLSYYLSDNCVMQSFVSADLPLGCKRIFTGEYSRACIESAVSDARSSSGTIHLFPDK